MSSSPLRSSDRFISPSNHDDDGKMKIRSSSSSDGGGFGTQKMKGGKGADEIIVNMRQVSRTPSPTPSEAAELNQGFFDLKAMKSWRYWIRKEWTCESLFPRSSYV